MATLAAATRPRVTPPRTDPLPQALDQACRRLFGPVGSPLDVTLLARNGWTPDLVTTIGALAAWATATRTGLASADNPLSHLRTAAQQAATTLFWIAHRLMDHNGLTPSQASRWLTPVAGAPDLPSCDRLCHLLYIQPDPCKTAAWLALGPIGPLAYAAGLTREEVAARQADAEDLGALFATLRSMAALRGYRLPSTP